VTLVVPEVLRERARATEAKLAVLDAEFAAQGLSEASFPDVAVIATGSLGRGELGARSDLDLFLIDTGAPALGNLDTIALQYKLIQVGAGAGFEPFSNDGEYLTVQHMDDLLAALGTRADESSNAFTARMLLLLESRSLVGRAAYERCVSRAVEIYAREAGPDEGFMPQFLVNDLVRYWKTLCLNYEARRHELHRLRAEAADGVDALETKLRIQRLKLRFNRLWTCFNGLVFVLSGVVDGKVHRAHIARLAALTPVQRAEDVAARFPQTQAALTEALALYARFLAATDADKDTVFARFSDEDTRREMYDDGRRFGDLMAAVTDTVSEAAGLKRFLLL
jgi:hypothetical protein